MTMQRGDLLERPQTKEPTVVADLADTNRLLWSILFELRKSVAKVQAEARVVEGFQLAGGIFGADFNVPALLRFYYNNNPIKSLYTIISNGTAANPVWVTINEPSVNLGLASGAGIYIPGQGHVILKDVEIETLTVRVAAAATAPIPINQIGSSITGMLSIYSWTLREYAHITE